MDGLNCDDEGRAMARVVTLEHPFPANYMVCMASIMSVHDAMLGTLFLVPSIVRTTFHAAS